MILRAATLAGILLLQATPQDDAPVARPEHMRYERAVTVPAGEGQACAVLDGQIFPHAAPSLKDLRLFSAGAARELPYAITLSDTETEETEPARVLNLGQRGGSIVFDLQMPDRPYTEVTLDLAGQDFLATATVSGMDALGGSGRRTELGVFTLFDLSAQHLSRDTTLPLAESSFPYLHVELAVSAAPGTPAAVGRFVPAIVQGAHVPPSREAQMLYTTVAASGPMATTGRESRVSFVVPARVPVERITFALAAGFKGNFSRDVRVTAAALATSTGDTAKGEPGNAAARIVDEGASARRPAYPETLTGNILRVHTTQGGREIRTERLSVPAILGANLQSPAKVEVTLENGDDQPLPIAEVRLEMRQRRLCFDASASGFGGLDLYYGDPDLPAPVYDYERLFVASNKALNADLGPELLNPIYAPPPAKLRPFTERHPEVLWIALIAVICVLGVVALRSSRNVGR